MSTRVESSCCCILSFDTYRSKLWPHYIFFSFFVDFSSSNSHGSSSPRRLWWGAASSSLLVSVCTLTNFDFSILLLLLVFIPTFFRLTSFRFCLGDFKFAHVVVRQSRKVLQQRRFNISSQSELAKSWRINSRAILELWRIVRQKSWDWGGKNAWKHFHYHYGSVGRQREKM